jgi:hypothetical protein
VVLAEGRHASSPAFLLHRHFRHRIGLYEIHFTNTTVHHRTAARIPATPSIRFTMPVKGMEAPSAVAALAMAVISSGPIFCRPYYLAATGFSLARSSLISPLT